MNVLSNHASLHLMKLLCHIYTHYSSSSLAMYCLDKYTFLNWLFKWEYFQYLITQPQTTFYNFYTAYQLNIIHNRLIECIIIHATLHINDLVVKYIHALIAVFTCYVFCLNKYTLKIDYASDCMYVHITSIRFGFKLINIKGQDLFSKFINQLPPFISRRETLITVL